MKIYCIEDVNGNKYIGKTIDTLRHRLQQHICHKKCNHGCSSKFLDLDNSTIELLETCNECDAKYREQYWKDNTICVNINNPVHIVKEYNREYYKNNREQRKGYDREYYKNNREHIKCQRHQYRKDYNLFNSKRVCNGSYDFIMMLEAY